MKIELEQVDYDFIKQVNEQLGTENCRPLFLSEIGKNYYINFTCTDIAKANNLMLELLNSKRTEEIEEKFGIRINSLNFSQGDNKIGTLKNYLKNFLNELEYLEKR